MDKGDDISEISEKALLEEEPQASVKELEQKVDKTIKKTSKEKSPEPTVILEPHSRFVAMVDYTVNRIEPDKVEVPVFIDMKKAEEDYNSPDYMLLSFNRRNGYLHPSSVV
jgi:hypothetical protein